MIRKYLKYIPIFLIIATLVYAGTLSYTTSEIDALLDIVNGDSSPSSTTADNFGTTMTATGADAIVATSTTVETETHASEHAPNGADPVDKWYYGGAIDDDDTTPEIAVGYFYQFNYTSEEIIISDFFLTGQTDHTGLNDGDYVGFLCNDVVTFDFDGDPGTLEGNATTNFTCSGSELVFIEFVYRDGVWHCVNLNSGFSNPTTLAIAKAQFDYTIANPQAYTMTDGVDASATDVTLGTEIVSSVVKLSGPDDDGTSAQIDLQDASSGWDGVALTFHAYANCDIDDKIIIALDESDCANCSFDVFEMTAVGATLSIRWDNTTSKWFLLDWFNPMTEFGTVLATSGFAEDPSPETNDNINCQTKMDQVYCTISIGGESNDTDFTFTLPYTLKNGGGYNVSVPATVKDNNSWQTGVVVHDTGTDPGYGRIACVNNEASCTVYSNSFQGAWTSSNDKHAIGSFTFIRQ